METMATFRLFAESGGSSSNVTARLGLTPTFAYEAGDPVSTRRPDRVRDQSAWQLAGADRAERDTELSASIRRLLHQLEPVSDELWALVADGWWANWFCFVGSHATEHAAELDRVTLQRLIALPGDLWLDVYPSGEDDTIG